MDNSEDDGMLSGTASWMLDVWRGGFADDPLSNMELRANHPKYRQRIMSKVRRTAEVITAADHATEATIAFCNRHRIADAAELQQLRTGGLSALDELERACRKAGLSDEARALGA